MIRYFSMFSGIGGFELGIQQAYASIESQKLQRENLHLSEYSDSPQSRVGEQQHTCIGYSEIDKYAIQIYEKHFKHKNYGDATTINASELPDFDLLVGGFPCQAFSIAGKRKGLDDTRGTLFYDIARIAKEKRPQHLLLENVKGLLSHDNGRTFKLIISTFAELGYNLEWQVLNSKNFGVPQNRERVFIIGHLGRCCGRQVFPITGQGNENSTIGKSTETAVARTLTGGGHTGGNHSGMTILQVNQPTHSNDRVYSEQVLAPTLNTMQGGQRQPFVARQPLRFLDRNQRNVDGKHSFTVDTSNTGGVKIDSRIRRLTPTECERLQGYPDGWTEGVSDTQRYKTLGNAVTVNVIKAIIEKLI